MKKSEVVQIRLTKEQKELFKEVSKEMGTNMSELMIVATENIVKRHREKMSLQKNITDRAMRTDKKLAEIAKRIRNGNDKKILKNEKFIFKIFHHIIP